MNLGLACPKAGSSSIIQPQDSLPAYRMSIRKHQYPLSFGKGW